MSSELAQTVLRSALRLLGGILGSLERFRLVHWLTLRAIGPVMELLFDAGQARDLHATFELVVRHPRGRSPQSFELQIDHGRCSVRRTVSARGGATALVADSRATATADAADLIQLGGGRVGWPELLSRGRLELSGDPFLALRFPALFRLPAAGADVAAPAGVAREQ